MKPKILYIVNENLLENKGIERKISNQIKELKSYYNVKFINLNTNNNRSFLLTFLLQFYVSSKLILSRDTWRYDLIYSRMLILDPSLFILILFRKNMLEVNGDLMHERKLCFIKKTILTFYIFVIHRLSTHIIYVTEELSKRFYSKSFSICGNRISNIEKTIDHKTSSNDIIFVGSPGREQSWHGFDLLLPIIRIMPNYNFHIFGSFNDDNEKWVDLKNIFFHGVIDEDQILSKINSHPVLAFSSLAMFRAGILEASPLKSRFYFKNCIPVIGSYNDTDVKNPKFFLKLESLDIDVINKFINIERTHSEWLNLQKNLSFIYYRKLFDNVLKC